MRQLLIFLKYPTPRQVKTRLAQVVGDEGAADIYRACVEVTVERLRRFQRDTMLYVDPPEALERVRSWLGAGWALRPQQGSTLGERLAEATCEAFDAGAKQVVVIGTDSPWLQSAQIEAAFTALRQRDVVLGPTDDGGYYLIGLSQPAPRLFDGVAWSSPRVFIQTERKARALGLRTHALAVGYDLDYLDDLERFLEEERRRGPLAAPVERMNAWSGRRMACPS